MKKFPILFIFILLCVQSISFSPAQADTSIIRITDVPHRTFDGIFRNNELASEIAINGRLWNLVFLPDSSSKIWVIDAALIDEIFAMTTPYTIANGDKFEASIPAQEWIAQLVKLTVGAQVVALPYGNCDPVLTKKIAPRELSFYYTYGQDRLANVLGRAVRSEPLEKWSIGRSNLPYELRSRYSVNRNALQSLATFVSPSELIDLRAHLGQLLSPMLSKADRQFYSFNATQQVYKTKQRLRIFSGKYQLTSSRVKLPVTLENDFDSPVTLRLNLSPSTSRVIIGEIGEITLAPRSKTQFAIPLEIVAPGTTTISAEFVNTDGQKVSNSVQLLLNMTVIDSRVAWFTTGAAVLLFVGAITQSVRRVRRTRK